MWQIYGEYIINVGNSFRLICVIYASYGWSKLLDPQHGWSNTQNNHTSHTSVLHAARTFNIEYLQQSSNQIV